MWEPIELKKLLSYLLFQSMPNSDGYTALKDHFKDMVMLESTGLLDKNGKEIYENMEINNKYKVIYDPPTFCLQDILSGDILLFKKGDCYEITGEFIEIS